MSSEFQKEHPLERRLAESERIRKLFPDRVPVICERHHKTKINDIDKKKFLVPGELNVGQFIQVIRKRINLDPAVAMFIFLKNTLPPTSSLLSSLYDTYKDEDGFLYVIYAGDDAFGS